MSEDLDVQIKELDSLRNRANTLGLTFHPNMGVTKLRALVEDAMGGNEPVSVDTEEPKVESKGQRITRLRKEASRLVRVVVTNMNPTMKDHDSAIYTVSNSVVGTHKKLVPFNNTEGWHVPQIIVNHMKERTCQIWVNGKGPRGEKVKVKKMIPELNVIELNALTPAQLKDLATQQAMANNLD